MRVILREYEAIVAFGLDQWEPRHDNLFQRQAVNYPMSWTSKSLVSTQKSKFQRPGTQGYNLGWKTLQDTQMAI